MKTRRSKADNNADEKPNKTNNKNGKSMAMTKATKPTTTTTQPEPTYHHATTSSIKSSVSVTTQEKTEKKSAYELAREEKLRQNRLRMMELGLSQSATDLAATLETSMLVAKESRLSKNASSVGSKNRKRKEPVRHSKRMRGLGPDGNDLSKEPETEDEKEKIAQIKKLVELYGRW